MADLNVNEMPQGAALRDAYERVAAEKATELTGAPPAAAPADAPEQGFTAPAQVFAPDSAEFDALPAGLKALWSEKHDGELMEWAWGGGAQDFEELEKYRRSRAIEDAVEDVMWSFQMLTENIMRDQSISAAQKAERVQRLAASASPKIAEAEQRAVTEEGRRAASETATPPAAAPDAPEDIDRGSFRVFKDNDGNDRWLGLHSNNYRDREGEIFAAEAHKEYAEWAMGPDGKLPTLRLWHTPIDIGDADMVGFDGSFMVSSGTFRKEWQHVAESLKASTGEALGMSHGFQYRPEDLRDGVYHKYRSFEVSVLPLDAAANEFTAYFAKDLPMLTPETRTFLQAKGGDEYVKHTEQLVSMMKQAADETGVDYKSMVDAVFAVKDDDSTAVADATADVAAPAAPLTAPAATTEPEATEPEAEGAAPEAGAPEAADSTAPADDEADKGLTLDAIKAAISDVVAPIAADVEALKAAGLSDDERIANMLKPSTTGHRAAFSGSRDGEEVPTAVAEAMKIAETESSKSVNDTYVSPYVGMLDKR